MYVYKALGICPYLNTLEQDGLGYSLMFSNSRIFSFLPIGLYIYESQGRDISPLSRLGTTYLYVHEGRNRLGVLADTRSSS